MSAVYQAVDGCQDRTHVYYSTELSDSPVQYILRMFQFLRHKVYIFTKNEKVLQEIDYFSMVDYFSLGVIVYEMAFGKHPFITRTDNWEQIKKKVIEMDPDYEEGMDPDLYNLLVRLLWKDQEGRNHLVSDIRSHPFFKTIDWAELEGRKSCVPSESEPICEEPSNNSMPLNEFINNLAREAPISPYEQEYFTGFSYMSDSLMMSPMDLFSPPPSSPEKKLHFADCSNESELQRVEPMDWAPLLPLKIHGPVPTPMENHYNEALQQLAEQMVFFQPPPAVRQENLFTPWPIDYEEAHKNLKEPEEQNYIFDFGYKSVSQIQQPPQDFFPMAYNQKNLFTPWPMYHEEAHNNVIEPEEQNYIFEFGYKSVSQIQEPPQNFFPMAYSQENLFTPWPMYHEEAHSNVVEPEAQQHLCDIFLPSERQDNGLPPWPMYYEEAYDNIIEPNVQFFPIAYV